MHPSELKIIVYAARNLRSKRKEGVCQASVIFGVGKDKYRTEVVTSDNPTWNEESVIRVSNVNASLVLKVTDREDSLGEVTLSVASLPSAAHKRRWLPLMKKDQPTSSDICFDCWVSKFKQENIWDKFNPFFTSTQSPQEKRRESIANASTSIRGSTSSLELCTKGFEKDRRESQNETVRRLSSTCSIAHFSTGTSLACSPSAQQKSFGSKLFPTLGAVMSMKGPPEVTGISPRLGASKGATKITIRGSNLGTCLSDILGLSICSVDHLGSLEYHSPAKLVCTTQSWDGRHPNPGPIVLVTKSGGRGVSTVEFEFLGEPVVVPEEQNTEKQENERKNSVEVDNLRQNVQVVYNKELPKVSYKKEGTDGAVGPDDQYPDWLWTLKRSKHSLEELDPQSRTYARILRKKQRREENERRKMKRF